MTDNIFSAKRIKILLAQNEMSFKELAHNVGMTQQGLRRSILKGTTSYTIILKISEILDVDINYLIKK